jgi:hypothetical protein
MQSFLLESTNVKSNKFRNSKGKLIEDLSENSINSQHTDPSPDSNDSVSTNENGPSMLELMMMEQENAKKEQEKLKVEKSKKATKTFGSGFQKGFLNSNSKKVVNSKPMKPQELSNSKKMSNSDHIVSTTNPTTSIQNENQNTTNIKTNENTNVTTITKNESSSSPLVLNEVQDAMQQEQNAMKQLQQGGELSMLNCPQNLIFTYANNRMDERRLDI